MELKYPHRKLKVLPAFVITGFILPVFYAAVWIVASILDGNWIFGVETLSDMGICMVPEAEMVFNYGCAIAGALGFYTGYEIMRREKNWLFLTGACTMISMVFLMGVGAVNKGYGRPHLVLAVLMFVFIIMAMVFSVFGDWLRGRRVLAAIEAALVAACFISMFFRIAILEPVCIMCFLAWCPLQSWRYFRIIGFIDFVDPVQIILDGSKGLR